MSIYKRGNTWWLNVTGADGRQIRVSAKTGNRHEAVEKEAALRLKLGKPSPLFDISRTSNPSISFKELAEEFLKYQKSIGRRSAETFFVTTVRTITPFFKDQPVREIDDKTVERFRAARIEESSVATANRSIAVLRRMFTLGMRWGFMDRNPVQTLDPLKEPRHVFRVLTPAEQAAYLSACRPDFRSLAWFALRTGMRRGELLSLKARDVDTWRSLVSLPMTKAGHPRHIPVHPKVAEALGTLTARRQPSDFALQDQRGLPWTATVVRRCHANACKDARLKFRFHDLRHTFASDLLASGVPIVVVQNLLGHESVKTTEIYAHLSQTTVKQALQDYGRSWESKESDTIQDTFRAGEENRRSEMDGRENLD